MPKTLGVVAAFYLYCLPHGIMVPEKLTDLLHTNYRSDLNMFVGRWGYQPATELLSRAYELLKDNALANGCRFWLQDIRRRTFNDPVITNWLLTEYFPQMSAQLGGRLRVAYLTGPDLLAAIRSMPNFLPPAPTMISLTLSPFSVPKVMLCNGCNRSRSASWS